MDERTARMIEEYLPNPPDPTLNVSEFWCWWMSRYLLFLKKIGDRYLFTDYGDQQILLTDEEVSMLSPG